MIDPKIKLRHITGFLEVARQHSVVKAAETLHISQPAVTKTIQELEVILGELLFDRSGRNLTLTASGEKFYRHASASMAALHQGIEASRADEEDAVITIGALPTVSASLLPDAVRKFSAIRSNARLRIITAPNNYLLSLLRTARADLVIGRMAEPGAMLGFSFEHLYSEKVVLAVRPNHPLLSAPHFRLGLITALQVLVPTPDAVIRPLVESLLLAHGVTALRERIETVSNAFGRAYVQDTDAVWIISAGVVARDVMDGHLALLPVDNNETFGPVGLTSRTDSTPSPALTGLLETIRNAAAKLR